MFLTDYIRTSKYQIYQKYWILKSVERFSVPQLILFSKTFDFGYPVPYHSNIPVTIHLTILWRKGKRHWGALFIESFLCHSYVRRLFPLTPRSLYIKICKIRSVFKKYSNPDWIAFADKNDTQNWEWSQYLGVSIMIFLMMGFT